MTSWNGKPALGVVLTQLVELATRVERVRLARQSQAAAKMVELLARKDSP